MADTDTRTRDAAARAAPAAARGWRAALARVSWGHVQLGVALVAFVAALVALHGELQGFHYRQVIAYVDTLGRRDFALALACAVLSLAASSSLDLFALRHVG